MSKQIRRGEVYYVSRNYSEAGSEQRAGRPAVVVSNDNNNAHSGVVEVVYMTTKPKAALPTHCKIHVAERDSTVLCEQVHSVFVDRLDGYVTTLTPQEMQSIDDCLRISLALQDPGNTAAKSVSKSEDIVKLHFERDFYKQHYEELLRNILITT